jgi:hypothetical protein
VFISGSALRKNSISLFRNNKEGIAVKKVIVDKSDFMFILFMGLCLGLATTLLFNIFPAVFTSRLSLVLPGINGKLIVVAILVLSAVLSIPLSSLVNREGLKRSFFRSLIGLVLSMSAILFMGSPSAVIAMTIVFSIAFTTLSVSALPLAIQLSRFDQKVFCVGIFFTGVAIPDAIVNIVIGF